MGVLNLCKNSQRNITNYEANTKTIDNNKQQENVIQSINNEGNFVLKQKYFPTTEQQFIIYKTRNCFEISDNQTIARPLAELCLTNWT